MWLMRGLFIFWRLRVRWGGRWKTWPFYLPSGVGHVLPGTKQSQVVCETYLCPISHIKELLVSVDDWGWGPHVSGLWTLNWDSCTWGAFGGSFCQGSGGAPKPQPRWGVRNTCHLFPAWLPLLFGILIERSSPSEPSPLGDMSSFTVSGLPACSAEVGARVIGVCHLGLRYILPDIIWGQI